MAKFVLRNAYVLVNAVDLSARARSVTITTSRPEVEVTAMGSLYQEFVGGIPDATIEVEYYQDLAAGSVDATHTGLVNSDTPFTVEIRAVNAARSATNPAWVMTALLLGDYQPVAGSVADAATTTVTYRNAAPTGISRLTA